MGGTSRENMMGCSWMGFRFLGLETIPCLVLYLDQTLLTIEGNVGIWSERRIHLRDVINQLTSINRR